MIFEAFWTFLSLEGVGPYLSEAYWTTRGFPATKSLVEQLAREPALVPQALPGRNLSAADRTTAWPSLEPLPSGCPGDHDELQPAKKPFALPSLSLPLSFEVMWESWGH